MDIKSVKKFIDSLNLTSKISLINCAGISYNAFVHNADFLKWKRVIEVNVIGTFDVIHSILPFMEVYNFGRMINFASVVTKLSTSGVSAYPASKSALIGFTKTLVVENAFKGITVHTINLGYTDVGVGINDVPENYKVEMMNRILKHRFCLSSEVYNIIEYLIKTDYIIGSVIDINGGIV